MTDGGAILEARGVTKVYETRGVETHALNGVDLEIGEGEFTALSGPSGSGKTTLLNLFGALDEPTRRDVCAELVRVQRELRLATIHVCHSLAEARSVADRVGVMEAGTIHQTGTIADLTAEAATEAVGRLMNVTPANGGPTIPGDAR